MRKIAAFLVLVASMALAATASASMDCFEDPAGNNVPYGAGFDREGTRDRMMKETQDPAMDLLMCFTQSSFEGPEDIVNKHCGCREAIEELCEFKRDDGRWKVRARGGAKKAWCVAFLPAMT